LIKPISFLFVCRSNTAVRPALPADTLRPTGEARQSVTFIKMQITTKIKLSFVLFRWECGLLGVVDSEDIGRMATLAYRIISKTGSVPNCIYAFCRWA
jgi:hypothetical protein